MHFVGILNPSDFRLVTRAHLIAWRKDLEQRQPMMAVVYPSRWVRGRAARFSCVLAVHLAEKLDTQEVSLKKTISCSSAPLRILKV